MWDVCTDLIMGDLIILQSSALKRRPKCKVHKSVPCEVSIVRSANIDAPEVAPSSSSSKSDAPNRGDQQIIEQAGKYETSRSQTQGSIEQAEEVEVELKEDEWKRCSDIRCREEKNSVVELSSNINKLESSSPDTPDSENSSSELVEYSPNRQVSSSLDSTTILTEATESQVVKSASEGAIKEQAMRLSELHSIASDFVNEMFFSATSIVNQIDDRLRCTNLTALSLLTSAPSSSTNDTSVVRCGINNITDNQSLSNISNTEVMQAKQFVEEFEEFHDSCSEIPEAELVVERIITELKSNVNDIINHKTTEIEIEPPVIEIEKKAEVVSVLEDDTSDLQTTSTTAVFELDENGVPPQTYSIFGIPNIANYPKILYNKNYNSPMVEITDQNIEILHRHEEVCENNPDMVATLVYEQQQDKEQVIDEDDVYRPVSVSPCGR